MRIQQIVENSTTAGSVATVAQPLMTQTRESVDVPGLKPVQQVMKGKVKKKGPYANSISEGKVKELSIDLKELTDADFKKKYGKTKVEIRASMKKEVTEDDLSEQDLIIIPGQGRLKRTGFVPNDSKGNILDKDLSSIDPDDQGEEEGSFVKNQIHTMLRVLKHLENAIGDEEDLPEWVQMKLSQAQQSVVGVMDYMISDKEREVERHTGHASLMKENNNQRVDSIVTDALKVIKGPEISDAVLALKRVLGDRAYNERRGFYSFYVDQIHDMYNQQNINELSSGLLGRAAQAATDKRNQAMEPKLHDALGGGYMNPLAKHYDNVSQKMNNRAAQVKNKETIQKNASKIASPAVMRKMGITEGDVSTGNLQTMYSLARMAKNYCSDPEGKEALTELLRILKWYMDQGSEQGVAEGKIDFAKKLQGKVDKHNKALVKTKKEIGSRVVDIGAGGKEHNEKTDAAWDAAKKKVSEGAKVDRMVKHVAQSEKKLGHSDKEAENIAWATANKRGMLDNKNKKK